MARDAYVNSLRRTFEELTEQVELGERERRLLRSRWLDQVVWMERRAAKAQRLYYRLRIVTVVGAVLVPSVVSLTALEGTPGRAARIVVWILSLVVAVSAAVEGFFAFGERWRNYRGTVERLKMEGWLFLQSAGPYAGVPHADAYPAFAARVEELIQSDVDVYLTEVVAGKQKEGGAPAS